MRQCYPQNAKLTQIDAMGHAKVCLIAETPVFERAHSRHHNKPDPYLQDCIWSVNIQLQTSQAWNCILIEESVKGAVSSQNLELRATEIKEIV